MQLILVLHFVGYYLVQKGPVFQDTAKIESLNSNLSDAISDVIKASAEFRRSLDEHGTETGDGYGDDEHC